MCLQQSYNGGVDTGTTGAVGTGRPQLRVKSWSMAIDGSGKLHPSGFLYSCQLEFPSSAAAWCAYGASSLHTHPQHKRGNWRGESLCSSGRPASAQWIQVSPHFCLPSALSATDMNRYPLQLSLKACFLFELHFKNKTRVLTVGESSMGKIPHWSDVKPSCPPVPFPPPRDHVKGWPCSIWGKSEYQRNFC